MYSKNKSKTTHAYKKCSPRIFKKKKKKQDCENVNYIIYKKENLIEWL